MTVTKAFVIFRLTFVVWRRSDRGDERYAVDFDAGSMLAKNLFGSVCYLPFKTCTSCVLPSVQDLRLMCPLGTPSTPTQLRCALDVGLACHMC